MTTCIQTTSENSDFQQLVKLLDAYLAEKDGNEHAFYAQYNKTDDIKQVIVAYRDDVPVGCGAIKAFSAQAMEVKRMYVKPEHRGQGIASLVLTELESWAKLLGYEKCLLETGKRQQEAVALYQKNGYQIIPNYGQYIGVDNSVCFEKILM
ncbi:GNAT family N-acetyltransferase [Pedobacter sp. KR3-3]|uniref:GNAT family N-acetyltransferase n=1 Tax=Pedobacter albus TaxID=3113905 RepID=A0ABU7I6I9_9SPHI|nr:GNAT family N-acetyltransferase [Pedobacter sp. KR3-3]MEE1944989.1 GNAT family N-acetyltransferase [Pedobacter sp. KR3-3]